MTQKMQLKELDDSNENQLTINQEFAKKYQEKKRKEELGRRKCSLLIISHGKIWQRIRL